MVVAQNQTARAMDYKEYRNKPTLLEPMILNKGTKSIHQRRHFEQKVWENWTATCRIMKLDSIFHPVRWIKDSP